MALLTRIDVTGVKLSQNFIVAGIGSFLEVFKKESGTFLQKLHVLRGQKIYGIVPSTCDSKFLVFGGKQFAILLFKNNSMEVEESVICHHIKPIICNDWIHRGIWVSEDNVALLTAHNVVQIWNTETQLITQQHVCPDRSILYSGLLLLLQSDILIFSGTVYSEVIIHWCGDETPLQYLKGHKGVIFSITCDPQRSVIVTTSDDRSVRIWNISSSTSEYMCKDYWINANIICTHELYGHSARVIRSFITRDYFISGGEDSGICIWDHEGKLLRKVVLHQNACIWSIDADEEYLVTGGSDSSVVLHPLSLLTDYGHNEIVDIDKGTPKKLEFTARGNIVIINDGNEFIYCDSSSNKIDIYKLSHESTFKLLSLSPCKQIIAVTDMSGILDVFIENCKGNPEIRNIIHKQLQIGKILSMHWVSNRHLIFCSENGILTVLASKENDTEIFATYILPHCKERWITSGSLSCNKEILVLGDRSGHIHIYCRGSKNPIKTFDKVHGRYGATSITIRNNKIITTGRDGTIKYFSINKDNGNEIKYLNCKDLDFPWVEKFLDKSGNYICGFQERIFVVYDIKNNIKVLEVNCGGGHRSWDAVRYYDKVDNNLEEFIRLIYLKNSTVRSHTFQLSKIVSKNIVNGTHTKEINCLKTYVSNNNEFTTFYISGGEDTTLRVSSSYLDKTFRDEVIFKQLSNVRCLKLFPLQPNKILLISAGGRAQICARTITFYRDNDAFDICSEELVDYMIKGTDKERKGNRNWKSCSVDFDPETRVMDLDIVKIDDFEFLIFAGCSDGVLRVFNLKKAANVDFTQVQEIKYHKTCILRIHVFKFLDNDILATCTTRGEVALWDVTSCLELSEPIFLMQTNKSGINCIGVQTIDLSQFLMATGGDDNAIHLNVIGVDTSLKVMKILDSWSTDRFHCSQITGLKLIDELMVTTGIDQRVTLSKWSVAGGIDCVLLSQHFSDVADIQGLDILNCSQETVKVCVFGKGIQVLELLKRGNM